MLECITACMDDLDELTEAAVIAAVHTGMAECGRTKLSDDDLSYVLTRAAKHKDAPESPGEEGEAAKRGFASDYLQWVEKMTPAQMCMYLAEYDLPAARALYCDEDCDDVLALAEQKLARDWENVKVLYESVLFGFGGGYSEEEAPVPAGDGTATIDTDDPEFKKLREMMRL
jgi:hypothetical protein